MGFQIGFRSAKLESICCLELCKRGRTNKTSVPGIHTEMSGV